MKRIYAVTKPADKDVSYELTIGVETSLGTNLGEFSLQWLTFDGSKWNVRLVVWNDGFNAFLYCNHFLNYLFEQGKFSPDIATVVSKLNSFGYVDVTSSVEEDESEFAWLPR